MIPRETIDRISEAARIEEVVGDFITLKKRGVNYIGLCPFHNEKSPSFTVSPAKGIFKCFGCSAGGNSVNFVMDHEHMTYPEALRYLAAKYHIPIEEEEFSPEELKEKNEREELFIISSFAQKHFSKNLMESEEGRTIGLSYFKERGFKESIIEKFQLGYSPEKFDDLVNAAHEHGYKKELLIKAGLAKEREGNYFDFFRGRVVFPIHNHTGKVIAFGARTLKTDKKIPKYLNSPETEIYNKSKTLYGLAFAKKSIIQNDNCFLVEGYTDVVSLFQSGVENVVASSGTSLTTEQIRLIKRFTPNITILYDGDNAGIKASFRGIDMILEEGMNVKVVLFPDGDDPDSYSKKVSTDQLLKYISENAQDFIVFKTRVLSDDGFAKDPIKKASFINEIGTSIALIPNPQLRSDLIKKFSEEFKIDEKLFISEINKKVSQKYVSKQKEVEKVNVEEESANDEIKQLAESLLLNNELYPQEKDLTRILLNYGHLAVQYEVLNEDGKPNYNEEGEKEIVETTVAEFIVFELRKDNIWFDNIEFADILNEYELSIKSGIVPKPNYFLANSNPKLIKLTVDFISSKYALSNNWKLKHKIYTKSEKEVLADVIRHTVYSFKLKKVMQLKYNLQEALRDESDEMVVQEHLGYITLLNELQKQLSLQLGRVVLK